MGGFRILDRRTLHTGPVLTLEEVAVEGPDGVGFDREVVRHPGAVSVVPVLADQRAVLLVRQYRAALGTTILEIPAGKRDVDGEAPHATAARELEEEVGMRAGRLIPLAEFHNSPGFCDEHSYVFLGLDLEPCRSNAQGPEERHMTIEHIALADVPRLIAEAAITDAKTIIGLLLARAHLGLRP